MGLDTEDLTVSMGTIARTVAIFLGIPLVAGYLTRTIGERRRGREWYEATFLPRISPIALAAGAAALRPARATHVVHPDRMAVRLAGLVLRTGGCWHHG